MLLFNGSVVISINVLILIPVRTTFVMHVIGIVITTESVLSLSFCVKTSKAKG